MALLGHNRTIGVIGIALGKFMSAICSNSPNLANSSGSLVATVVLPLYIGIVDVTILFSQLPIYIKPLSCYSKLQNKHTQLAFFQSLGSSFPFCFHCTTKHAKQKLASFPGSHAPECGH